MKKIFFLLLFFNISLFQAQQFYGPQRGQRGYIPPPKYDTSTYVVSVDVYDELEKVLPKCISEFKLDDFEAQILKDLLIKKFESYNLIVQNDDISKEKRIDFLKQHEIDFINSLSIILSPDEISKYMDMDFTKKKKKKKKKKKNE